MRFVHNLRMVAETENGLQNIMNNVNEVLKKYGMKDNVKKR